jgi:DNA-binding transcriptional regulator YhcF (GntR family)
MAMREFASITLNKYSNGPVYRQLGEAFYKLILDGALTSHRKLPPIRTLAQGLRVNNDTVINAYKYLESLGAVYSVVGSGTYVAEIAERELRLKTSIFPTEALKNFFSRSVESNPLITIFGFFCGENRR